MNPSHRTTTFICSVAIGFLVWSDVAAGQTQASLSGYVTDAAGAGLPGAAITLMMPGSVPHSARTDGSGRYALENVSPGAYVAEIRSGGVVLRRPITLAASSNTQDFQLQVGQLAEVVTITAQKREEPIERAPVAVSALSGGELEGRGVTQVTELSAYVPNLHITTAGGRATINYLALRGFLNNNQTVDPSMSIYVDGVPVTDFFSTAQTLFDVERIEVIKGPQGTLYGVNSQAGVIDIRSRRPTNEWRGTASAIIGTFASYNTSGAVSGPLVRDRLFLGIAGNVNGRDGFVRNVVSGDRYDEQFGWDGRLRLVWNPSPRWDLAFTAAGREIDDNAGYLFLPTDLAVFNRLPALGGRPVGEFEQALDHEGVNASRAVSASGQATYYGPAATMVYTTAWRRNRQNYSFDLDLTPIPIFATGDSGFRVDNNYHEVRVQSPPAAQRVIWISGLAYQGEERMSEPFVLVFPGNPFGVPPGNYGFGDSELRRHFVGVFGQGTLRSADGRVGVTGGLRYDRANGTLDRGVGPFAGFPGQQADFSNDIWLPKVGVDVRLSPTDLVYASVGRGWRTGGLNPFAPATDFAPYGAESSWTYEAGFRTVRPEQRVRVNAAVFLNRIANFQDLQRTGIFSYLGNAERASSYGIDLDGAFNPTTALEVSASLGTTRLRYDKYLIDISNNVRLDGKAVPEVPSYNASARGTYRFPLGVYLRGEAVFTGPFEDRLYVPPSPGSAPSVREFSLPAAQVYHLGAGVTRSRWSIGLLVRNVADTLYFTRVDQNFGFYSGYTEPMGVIGARRVVSLQLSTNF